jgi:hypothetical protein
MAKKQSLDSSPSGSATERPKRSAKRKKPGILARAAERVMEAVRDAQATDTFKTPQDTSTAEVCADAEILTDEEESAARREWAMGALEYREAQLKKFNGKTETMAQVMTQMRAGASEFALEIESGTAWFLNDGDPLRFEEEPVTVDLDAVREEQNATLKTIADAVFFEEQTRQEMADIEAEVRRLLIAHSMQRKYLRDTVVKKRMAEQRADTLRAILPPEASGDTRPEDQVDAPS